MILYDNEKKSKRTTSHYNTNDSGRINAGPYLGLTVAEAKDLNEGQQTDYNQSLKQKDRDNFMKSYNAGMDTFTDEWLEPSLKLAGSFTPFSPAITAADAYNDWQEGNKGSATLSVGLKALPYSKHISKLPLKALFKRGMKTYSWFKKGKKYSEIGTPSDEQ